MGKNTLFNMTPRQKVKEFGDRAVGLRWMSQYYRAGRTFRRSEVAKRIAEIAGEEDFRKYYKRADTLIAQALFMKEIITHSYDSRVDNNEHNTYAFALKIK